MQISTSRDHFFLLQVSILRLDRGIRLVVQVMLARVERLKIDIWTFGYQEEQKGRLACSPNELPGSDVAERGSTVRNGALGAKGDIVSSRESSLER